MAGKVETICEEKVAPVIESLGYDVVEIEYAKKVDGMNLTFVIDSPKGIFLEDCEKVHNTISELLDELNPTGDSEYILNVSSPGIDRPVKNYKDYLRNKGKLVEVKLFAPKDGKKSFEGSLSGFDEKEVKINQDGKELTFERETVAQILPVIKF